MPSRQGLGPTVTQLNEGGLDLNPDPSDEEGDVLGSLFTVLDEASKVLPALVNGGRRRRGNATLLVNATDVVSASPDPRTKTGARFREDDP